MQGAAAALATAATGAETRLEMRRADESVGDAVVRVARDIGADLIAMDSRGSGAVRHAVLGSVAMEVLKQSPVPVFLTGGSVEPPRDGSPYRVLITSDGSPASRAIGRAVGPVVSSANAEVTLLRFYVPSIADPGERASLDECRRDLAEFEHLLPAGQVTSNLALTIPEFETTPRAILRLARGLSADLIGMATHGHSARRHLVAGSVALSVLAGSQVPVLLARSP